MRAEQAVLVEGLEERAVEPSPTALPLERKLRLKPVDRQQVCLRMIDPDRLVGGITRRAPSGICSRGWI
jgi:hypothetical protein